MPNFSNRPTRICEILDVDELQLVLFECLRTNRDDPNLKPARDYIEAGSKSDADLELRTFLLAVQLARLFREYSISQAAHDRKVVGRPEL